MTLVTENELINKAVAPRVTEMDVDANIIKDTYYNHGLLTICVLELANGFTVLGESACASPENYNLDIGMRLSYSDAKNKIWALMGYALKEKLHKPGTFVDRMRQELYDLEDKTKGAVNFINSENFKALSVDDQDDLSRQANAMLEYASSLRNRLNRHSKSAG